MEKFTPLKSKDSGFLPEEPLGESLLELDGPGVRVWRPKSTTIVLGRSQKAELEIDLERAIEDNVPIFQRYGGGGCVVLDESSVCIGLRYPREGHSINITDFLKHSSEGIQLFLQETYQLDVEIMENYDLLLDGRKFLGCSLYMPKGLCLYLAVILMDQDALSKINKYLLMPTKVPEHRLGRTHDEFLTPLRNHIECTHQSFMEDLEDFMISTDWQAGPYSAK